MLIYIYIYKRVISIKKCDFLFLSFRVIQTCCLLCKIQRESYLISYRLVIYFECLYTKLPMTNKVGSGLQSAVNKSCGHPCLQQQGQRSGSHIPKVLLGKNRSLSCCNLQPLSLLTHHKIGYRANLSNPSSPGSSGTYMIMASPSQRHHGKYQKYNVQNGILAYYFRS